MKTILTDRIKFSAGPGFRGFSFGFQHFENNIRHLRLQRMDHKAKKKALTVKIIEIGNFEAVNHEYYIDIDPMQKWLPLYYSFVLI